MKTEQESLLAAALAYLARGWSVFPLCPPDHRGWTGAIHKQCCKRPGKRPLWCWQEFKSRRAESREVRRWWFINPAFNVGMAFGPVSGLVGVDVDGPEGDEALQAVSRGHLPRTLAFTTGGGGYRLLYAAPAGSPCLTRCTRTDGKPLHILGAGAYTVMPPSLHVCGVRYAWVDGCGPDEMAVAPAPGWMVRRMTGRGGKGPTRGGVPRVPCENSRVRRGAAYLRKCEPAIEGQGGDVRTLRVCTGLVHGIGLDVDTALALLLGIWNPTCQPPWSAHALRRKLEYAVAQLPDSK